MTAAEAKQLTLQNEDYTLKNILADVKHQSECNIMFTTIKSEEFEKAKDKLLSLGYKVIESKFGESYTTISWE